MSGKKQVVRRTGGPRLADFDEQWWPVTILLLGSAGCLGAYIWYRGDFHAADTWSNARVQLTLLGTTVGILLLGILTLRGRAQRRLQLGVFLSLFFHLALLYTTQRIYMAYVPAPPPPAIEDDPFDDVPVTLPDYLPTKENGDTPDDLTRPADAPVREEPKTEIAPALPPPVEPREKEAVEEPNPDRRADPVPLELERTELNAARRNEVASGEKFSRKELPDKMPTDKIPERQMNTPTQQPLVMNSPQLEAERREAEDVRLRMPKSFEAPANDRPRPDQASSPPQRQTQPEQMEMAAIDAKSALERSIRQAAVPELPAPSISNPAPQVAPAPPSPNAPDTSSNNRQETSAPAVPGGSPSQLTSPEIALPSNVSTPAPTARAETPEVQPGAVAVQSPRPPSRIVSGDPTAGMSAIPLEAPAVSAPSASDSAGGASPSPTSTAFQRGDQGTPQLNLELGTGVQSPLGAGAGTTVGGNIIGPRQEVTQGDSGAGSAPAPAVPGRPSASRAMGPADAPISAIPFAQPAGVSGANNVAGNAPSGAAQTLAPSTSAAGFQRGTGPGNAVGMPALPGSLAESPPATTAAGGGASGTANSLIGSTSSLDRSQVGNGAGNDPSGAPTGAGGSAVGRNSLAKLNPGDTLIALPGPGMISAPTTTTTTSADTSNQGGNPLTPSSSAGVEGPRREAAGMQVLVSAPEGPGGLAARPSTDIGIPSRRARLESEVAHLEANRMVLERVGGKRSGGGVVRDTAVAGLKQRDPTGRGELAKAMGGSEESERAVEMGLDFLARHQSPDGCWRLHDFGNGRPEYAAAGLADMESNTAGTGLALLAFLGAGYTHSDGKYAPVVEKGLGYLLSRQKPDGDLFVPPPNAAEANTWLYSHGIASIALCEALGMTRDDALLKDPAQRAINFIVYAQNPDLGGWRYLPRVGSDTSVSGWQLMALKSAERVGLDVPPQTYQLVSKWLDFAQGLNGDPTRYSYMPQSQFEHQKVVSRVMTAEALLMRQYLGWNRDHPNLTGGADYLLTQLPAVGSAAYPDRDSYYWYYATQVMFHMKGDHWRRWNERLRPLLVDSQVGAGPLAGSWDPQGDVPDRWGAPGGRLYVTAMHLLMLEVYYRYLPLYQNLEE